MQISWLLPGQTIWIKDQNIFVSATVVRRNDKSKEVQVDLGNHCRKTVPFQNCTQKSKNLIDYEDMCSMKILNAPQILLNLKKRYQADKIYTKIGPTLIAINPYKIIEPLYNENTLMKIRQRVNNGAITDNLSPHIYLLAGQAFNNLKYAGKKQAIVISGQSGAGKTQNMKHCMNFLTSLSHIHQSREKQKAIQDIILQSNPILQAFGNSKTVRNSNSSRFGKYVRLFINRNDQMTGARIQNYLLQKSRVTSVSKGQRNFHIFYYLLNSNNRQLAGLLANQKYVYLQSSGTFLAQGINDNSNFLILKESLLDTGFSQQNICKIWKTIGAILLLGNLDFKNNQFVPNTFCEYSDNTISQRICKNLDLTYTQLNELILQQKIRVGKQTMIKMYDRTQCIASKNTLSKALYSKLFQYIIQTINIRLWKDKTDDRSISILDIFGFEIFDRNSFEQLCINFTNQKLQKLYTKYIFENQLQELKRDGLGEKVKQLIPPDNRLIIQLIQKRMGISIFSLIDQKTALGAAKDEDIIYDLKKIKHRNIYVDGQPNKTTFMILHTQNPVVYSIEGFRLKNQDSVTLQIDLWINTFVPTSQIQELKGKTLVTKFDKQLRVLNEQLQSSQLHFIRCIKPNQQKSPDLIDDQYVLQQIKYLGVLQTIEIRKSAFPFRLAYKQFEDNFRQLIPYQKMYNKLSLEEKCMNILRKLFPGIEKQKNTYLLGKQRLYLKQNIQQKLQILI